MGRATAGRAGPPLLGAQGRGPDGQHAAVGCLTVDLAYFLPALSAPMDPAGLRGGAGVAAARWDNEGVRHGAGRAPTLRHAAREGLEGRQRSPPSPLYFFGNQFGPQPAGHGARPKRGHVLGSPY